MTTEGTARAVPFSFKRAVGRFPFHCDVFCGLGHGEMTGMIIVTE